MKKLDTAVVPGIEAKFPKEMVEFWGEDTLREIVDLFKDPLHDEINSVLNESDLTQEEQLIYMESSPELHHLRARLLALEDQVTKVMLPKFQKKLKRLIPKLGTPEEQNALKEWIVYFDFPNALRQFLVPGTHVRNMRVLEMISGIIQRMLFTVGQSLVDWKSDAGTVRYLHDITEGLFKELARKNGIGYAQSNLITFSNRARRVLRNTQSAFPEFLKQLPAVNIDQMEVDILRVDELISTRRKAFHSPTQIGNFVFVPPPASRPIVGALGIVEGAVVLDSAVPYQPPQWRERGGMEYKENPGAIEFTTDRTLHDMCIPLTHFSLEVFFETVPYLKDRSSENYLKLKAAFYHALADYLQSLPEDPKPVPEIESPADQMETINEAVEEVLEPAGEEIPEVEEFQQEATVVPSVGRIRFDECRGLRGSEVERILKRLLGEPIRVVGSHYFFMSSNGAKPPIALHGSAKVDPRALRENIEAWGITEAWRKALGRK